MPAWPGEAGESFFRSPRLTDRALEHFQAKWLPVRVTKMRKIKNLERLP